MVLVVTGREKNVLPILENLRWLTMDVRRGKARGEARIAARRRKRRERGAGRDL
jgi:hypothetical protein